MDRRNFLIGSAAALGAGSSVFGVPSDTVRVAVAGIGGRARDHIASLMRLPNVEIVALCDPDDLHLANGQRQVAEAGRQAPRDYRDIRKLLEDKSIDAVTIASPNHWHALMTVWACQAGKDVYVEKPCTHNMFETRQVVAAARRYRRIVQQGSQIRSSVAVREAIQKMNGGLIGDVYLARGLCFKWRDTIGRTPVSPVPDGVDYDLWTGPAPKREFTRNRFHYNWHWFWDTGGGELGNQAIHELDVARWGLGVRYPVKVSAVGGHFVFDDDQETPNVLNCAFEFEESGQRRMMELDVRHWMTNGEAGIEDRGHNGIGNLFYGSKGYLAVDSYSSYKSWLGREQSPGPARQEGGDHFANWLDAVRTRNRETLHAEIEEGAISTALLHLANISYRVGRTLHFDAASYSVVGDAEANGLFTREYRPPFVVPEKV
jgi:predicted dehydrogenase